MTQMLPLIRREIIKQILPLIHTETNPIKEQPVTSLKYRSTVFVFPSSRHRCHLSEKFLKQFSSIGRRGAHRVRNFLEV